MEAEKLRGPLTNGNAGFKAALNLLAAQRHRVSYPSRSRHLGHQENVCDDYSPAATLRIIWTLTNDTLWVLLVLIVAESFSIQ